MSDQPTEPARPDSFVEAAILDLCAERGAAKSIDPLEAAKLAARRRAAPAEPGPDDWHRLLGEVRRGAVRLAREGRLVIYRKGKPVDPDDFRGVYRLGLPREE